MNLIDESFEPKKTDNSKKTAKIILIIMVLLVIAIIGVMAAIFYIQSTTLKLYIDGAINEKVKEMMVVEEDGTIYFPIRDISAYLGYESFRGDYTDKSEDSSKCYIQSENEIANFSLNSNKIYKLNISENNENYQYYYADKPVKSINGNLYASIDAIEDAFNISFTYNTKNQRIYIYTMPYLIQTYSTRVLDYGYEKISEKFINQKTVFNNMLIVTKNQDKTYAVIDVNGKDVIEPKYDYIEYLPNTGDFLVKSNNKVGIISANKETKVQIIYDNLELIDSDAGLYLAKREDKYGVIDSRGNIKVYIEYDEIGIDITKFEKNDIKNKYLLSNGMIPVRKDKLWGAFDKNGNQILNFEYDSFGYVASSNKDAINLLIIPDYDVMVACKNKKYTLIGILGDELCKPILDDAYIIISSGKKHYYMNYNNITGVDIEEFLDQIGVKTNKNSTQNNEKNEEENKDNETEENNVVNNNENDGDNNGVEEESEPRDEEVIDEEMQQDEYTEQEIQDSEGMEEE